MEEFNEALETLSDIIRPDSEVKNLTDKHRANVHFMIGLCFERLNDEEQSILNFENAKRLYKLLDN